MKEKWINRCAVSGIIIALIFSLILVYFPDTLHLEAAGVNFNYQTTVFDKSSIMTVDILMEEEEWTKMLENAIAEEYYACDVVINGTTYKNVGIRPKGNTSLSQVAADDTTDRFSFKIEFDHYVSGQTCDGLDKLVLNNMMSDATYMKEYLSYEILNYLGVVSSLYSYADISVNGESWGLYFALEGMEESFAARNYGNSYGQLYKPEGIGGGGAKMQIEGIPDQGMPNQEISDQNIENDFKTKMQNDFKNKIGKGMGSDGGADLVYIDDEISSYSTIFESAVFNADESDYKRVIEALKHISTGEELESYVDIDAMLRYIAANVFLVNDDSYFGTMVHNYYLYEKEDVLTMLPWDYNLSFGGFQSNNASDVINRAIDTVVSGTTLEDRPMIGQILAIEEYKDQYHKYLNALISGYFESGLFEETIQNLRDLIDESVKNDKTAFYTYEEYLTAQENLLKFCTLRAESIRGQLDGTIPSTKEEQESKAELLIDTSSVSITAMGVQGGGENTKRDRETQTDPFENKNPDPFNPSQNEMEENQNFPNWQQRQEDGINIPDFTEKMSFMSQGENKKNLETEDMTQVLGEAGISSVFMLSAVILIKQYHRRKFRI